MSGLVEKFEDCPHCGACYDQREYDHQVCGMCGLSSCDRVPEVQHLPNPGLISLADLKRAKAYAGELDAAAKLRSSRPRFPIRWSIFARCCM